MARSAQWGRLTLEAGAIFLGVTLGFLADDLGDYRAKREREREALSQLLEDLRLDSADLAPILPRHRLRVEVTQWLSGHLDDPAVPLDSVVAYLNRLGQVAPYSYEPVTVTYSGLKATGELDVIRDSDLRRDIVFYFEDRQVVLDDNNQEAFQIEYDWWRRLASSLAFAPTDTLHVFPEVSVRDLPALRDDPEARFELALMGQYYIWDVEGVEELLQLNSDLAKSIRRRLGLE